VIGEDRNLLSSPLRSDTEENWFFFDSGARDQALGKEEQRCFLCFIWHEVGSLVGLACNDVSPTRFIQHTRRSPNTRTHHSSIRHLAQPDWA
jgi:hypothetical protein